MGLDFCAIDFETANWDRGSPCAVGLVKVLDGAVVATEKWLMRPPPGNDEFEQFNIHLHGITPDDVRGKPRFAERFPEILAFADGLPFVAHNAAFDMGVIRDACDWSEIEWPDATYVCTLVLARRTWRELLSYSLPWVVDAAGATLGSHHDPEADARAAADIAIAIAGLHGADSIQGLLDTTMCRLGVIKPKRRRPATTPEASAPRSPRRGAMEIVLTRSRSAFRTLSGMTSSRMPTTLPSPSPIKRSERTSPPRRRTLRRRTREARLDLLKRLFGSEKASVAKMAFVTFKDPRDDAEVEVVGELRRAEALEAVAGGRTHDGPVNEEHTALLVREPDNEVEGRAVAVYLRHQDDALKVGYLATPVAITYGPVFETIGLRAIQCPARLTGGWDRGGMDRGNIGVVLQLGTPGELGVQLWLEDHSVSTAHIWVGKTVVFTGKSLFSVGMVPLDKEGQRYLAEEARCQTWPRVTKKVDVCVASHPEERTGNLKKAEEYGLGVTSEADFWRALGVSLGRQDQP